MKTSITKKVLSIILSLLFVFAGGSLSVYADEPTSSSPQTTVSEKDKAKEEEEKAKKTLEEQRKELEEKLKESEKKLDEFEDSAKSTDAYIDMLDEKIGILNKELSLLSEEISEAQAKVDALNKQIEPLEKECNKLQKAYDKAEEEFNELNDSFTNTYNAYCLRLRAMYVSGSSSIIAALLTSEDISQFLNRYQMIRAISRSDTELLKEVNAKMEQIITKQDGLNERKAALEKTKSSLSVKRAECKKEQDAIEAKQKVVAEKKIILDDDRAESDRLFAIYSADAKLYTEFRNEDAELIEQVEEEISSLLSGLKTPDEITTAVTAAQSDREKAVRDEEAALYSQSNGVLNLTYPVPGHYGVSQTFGHYRNGRAHTGIDYPCPTGSKVVAAQKGTVIKVKRLNYSYGYYVMIYHGTDARGRKIVTLYAHNSSILVSVGQSVRKGQQIAKSGSTGNSTGPHCHFELIIDGAKVNAKNYLSKQ